MPLPPVGVGGGVWKGVLPNISHIVMCSPQRVGFLLSIGLKTGIDWNRVWFSRELRECIKVFVVSIPNK